MKPYAAAKLARQGNSTGLVLPKEVLEAAGFERGDEVALSAEDGCIEIRRAESGHREAVEIGRRFAQRYRRTLAKLAQ